MGHKFALHKGEKIMGKPEFHWVWFIPIALRYCLVGGLITVTSPWMFSVPYGVVLWSGASLLLIVYLVFHYWESRQSYFMITNQRILNVVHHGMFQQKSIEITLNKVQNVQAEVRGFFPTLFKYGTVVIHTAGDEGEVRVRYLCNAVVVQREILRTLHRFGYVSAITAPSDTPERVAGTGSGVQDLLQVMKRLVSPAEAQGAKEAIGFRTDSPVLAETDGARPRFKRLITQALLHPQVRDKLVENIRGELKEGSKK